MSPPPIAPSPPVPKIDYQALISEEVGKAKAQTDMVANGYAASLAKLDEAHALKFSAAAYSASEHAATFGSITKLIAYLAWDKAKGTSEAESYLNTLIEPSITPAVSDFHKDVNAETAKNDYELRKVTVQLSTNIAAIGPGNASPPSILDSSADASLEYDKLLKNLALKGAINSGSVVLGLPELLGKSILPKLIKPITSIAGRMFAKQIAKVAAMPVISSATGPVPIGPILAVIGLLWTGYDVYRMRPDFQDEVYLKLRTNLDEIRVSARTQASNSASTRTEEIRKVQIEIGAQALAAFLTLEAK